MAGVTAEISGCSVLLDDALCQSWTGSFSVADGGSGTAMGVGCGIVGCTVVPAITSLSVLRHHRVRPLIKSNLINRRCLYISAAYYYHITRTARVIQVKAKTVLEYKERTTYISSFHLLAINLRMKKEQSVIIKLSLQRNIVGQCQMSKKTNKKKIYI